MSNSHNIVEFTDGGVKKTYSSKERFSCELKNIQLFEAYGFRVPKIIRKDKARQQVVFNTIQGHVSLSLTDSELMICTGLLAKIYKSWNYRNDIKDVCKHYTENIRLGIQDFSQKHELTLNQRILNNYLRILCDNFDVGLFKDAKPSNWIFDGNEVYLIDFDYVKPSFYLADIAQLLNYQQLSNRKKYRYVDRFMELIEKEDLHVHLLFDLASINSRIMAMRYNENFDENRRSEFILALKDELRRIQLV